MRLLCPGSGIDARSLAEADISDISGIWGLLDGSESESWDIRKTCFIANIIWPVEEGGVRAAFNSQRWCRWHGGPGT